MNSTENPVAPEINRARTLEIFSAEQLAEFAKIGITPNQIIQLFGKLLPDDETIEEQFRNAMAQERSKSNPLPAAEETAVNINVLNRIFNILFEKQSELPAKIVELRWKTRLQIALLVRPEIIDKINDFMQLLLNEKKIGFGLMRSAVSYFIRMNRGVYNPEIVAEILTKPEEIERLLTYAHENFAPREIKTGEKKIETVSKKLILVRRNRPTNWEILNQKIYDTKLESLRFKNIIAVIESNHAYPTLKGILASAGDKKITIPPSQFPAIKKDLQALERGFTLAKKAKQRRQQLGSADYFAHCTLFD